jgi:hypothetical protein
MITTSQITRPPFRTVPLADGLRWRGGGGWRYEEKMDGVWTVRTIGSAVIVGEAMRDGRFFAFDVVHHAGQDLRQLPLSARLLALDELGHGEGAGRWLRPRSGQGGEFLEAVLARGGEGVVAKLLDSQFGAAWHKCKRVETFDLVVTEKATDRHAIRLATLDGEPRGWCPCFRDYNRVNVGDIVEIATYGLTTRGMLREPRFLRPRPDKAAFAL